MCLLCDNTIALKRSLWWMGHRKEQFPDERPLHQHAVIHFKDCIKNLCILAFCFIYVKKQNKTPVSIMFCTPLQWRLPLFTFCPLFAETCSATVKPVLMRTSVPIQIMTPFYTQGRKKEGGKNALLRTSESSTEEMLIILSSRLDCPAWTWRSLLRWGKIQRLQLSEGALSSSRRFSLPVVGCR